MEQTKKVCEKCKGTRRIQKADGTIQPCWDCLQSGAMDQHITPIRDGKDFGIKL